MIDSQDSRLIEEHMGLVNLVIKNLRLSKSIDKDELRQIGRIALWRLTSTKHRSSRWKFSTIAYKTVLWDIIAHLNTLKKYKEHDSLSINREKSESIVEYLPNLNALEKQFIDYYVCGFSLKEISIKCSKSQSWAYAKLKKIIEKIQHAQ